MQNDPQGQIALDAIGVDQFVLISDEAYDSVRSLLGEVSLPESP